MNEINDSLHPPICKGSNCDFAIDTMLGEGLCFSGSGSCIDCKFLEADSSKFHDEILIEATQKIKQILSEIPEDASGRKLSLFVTEMGVMLAWSSHGKEVPAKVVTAKDSREVVAQALKLKNV